MVQYSSIKFTVKLKIFSEDHEENRNNLRKIVIDKFSMEKAGHGKGEATAKYKYIVEQLSSADNVYLTRPVPLNKGFDFIIHVDNHKFQNKKDNPKHDDIIEDLKRKKRFDDKAYDILVKAIEDVFECKDPEEVLLRYESDLSVFKQGLPIDLILKVIKWLFIEQDIRYWNWSGRNMFMSGIKNI